jgi:hypothetical protein
VTQLNPFNGECYYLDKVGPIPGIAGYRVKAQEWLRSVSNKPGVRTFEEYRPATTEEPDFVPDAGDIAWVCTLFDTASQEEWEQRIIKLGTAYHQMGATFKEAHEQATKDAGPCPSWTAVGVVKAEEKFSKQKWDQGKPTDEYQPEKWDRNERAKKRAAKGCYRKAFPAVSIPDMEYGEVVNAISEDVVEEIKRDMQTPRLESQHGKVSILTGEDEANPEPVQDQTWEAWQELCKRADSLGVPYPKATRKNVTEADLNKGIEELAPKVLEAEDV